MTGPLTARRRAAEFDAAISRNEQPLTARDAELFADLLAVVRDLRSIPEITPRPEFVSSLRTQLMVEADTALVPQASRPLTVDEQRLVLPVRAHKRDRGLAAVLGGAALIGATSSMALAAQTALPGETLYPVKRALEDVRAGIAQDDSAKGRALLASAEGRLAEISELAARDDAASISAVGSTLGTFTQQADEAAESLLAAYATSGDAELVAQLRTFVSGSVESLSTLEESLPAALRDELVAAGQELADIDQRALAACPACDGGPALDPTTLFADDSTGAGVRSVLVAASQDPGLLQKSPEPNSPAAPKPISGADVDGIEIPDLTVPNPSVGPTATPAPGTKGTGSGGSKVDVRTPVSDVTKLLTGDLDDVTSTVPGAGETLSGVGGTVDDTVDDLQGTLDGTADSLLP